MAIPPTGAVPPQNAVIPTQPQGAVPQNLSLAVQSLPASLAQALGGAGLEAQIQGRTATGQTILSTPQGQIALQTVLAWPAGSNVTLTLQNAGPPPVLGLALQNLPGSSTGSSTGQTSGAQALPQTGQNVGASAPQPAVLTANSQGISTTATVLNTLPSTVQGGSPAPALPAQAAAPPPAAASTATAPTPTASQSGAPPQAGAAQPAAASPTQQPLPPGSHLAIRVLALAPQGQALPPLPDGNAQNLLTGQVLDGAPQGQALVATARGTLALNLASPPPGTRVALEVTGLAIPTQGGQDSAPRFTGLQDSLRALASASASGQVGAASALANLQASLPQPGPQLAAAALFFMLAGRSTTPGRTWLGRSSAEVLEGIKPGAADGLMRELGGVEGRARDTSGADWRMTSLPLAQEGRLEEIRLYRRPEDEEDEDGAAPGQSGKPIRFIVEAHFSRLGGVQLDTLTRPGHLDLMLRSLEPLDEETRGEIRALFAGTISALGKTGELGFQTVKRFDVAPVEADDPERTGETSA